MKLKLDFTSNTILQILILGVILYFSWGEKITVVLPIFIGTAYVAYVFTKNIMNSLIMAGVMAYTLLIILYKDHEREFFRNNKKHKN
mgnify:CR=1 FL=1